MPLTQPTEDIRFAENDVQDPVSGQWNVMETSSGKKDEGFDFKETPPRQWFNFLFRGIWKYVEWIKQEILNPGVYGASGLGTAAGRDIGFGEDDVPEFGTGKDLDVNEINGSKSSAATTGSTTNVHDRQVNASGGSIASGTQTQVNASSGCSATGTRGQVNGSYNSESSGNCVINSSSESTGDGSQTAISASKNAIIGSGASQSEINASNAATGNVQVDGDKSQINASEKSTIGASAVEAQINASDGCYISPASAKSNMQINASTGGCTAIENRSQVNACDDCDATGDKSQVNASKAISSGAIAASGECSQINASIASAVGYYASGECSQVNASFNVNATGQRSQVNCSSTCNANGVESQINASGLSSANGTKSQINTSSACATNAGVSQINVSINSITEHEETSILCSNRIKTGDAYSLCGGYAAAGDPLSSNRKWQIESVTGTIKTAAASVSVSYTFTDFAEYFENKEYGIIPLGTIVTLDGSKIRKAESKDEILGTITATAGFVCGDTCFHWKDRYLRGEFGEHLYDEIPDPDYKGDGDPPIIRVQRENPDFDPTMENIPRSKRNEEWSCVALIGQVHVRVDKDVKVGDFVDGAGEKSKKATRLLCMDILQPYDKSKGYAVALCLLR